MALILQEFWVGFYNCNFYHCDFLILWKFIIWYFSVARDWVRLYSRKQVLLFSTWSSFFVVFDTFRYFWYFLVLFGTFWFFLILFGTCWHFYFLSFSETEADKAHLPKCIRREVTIMTMIIIITKKLWSSQSPSPSSSSLSSRWIFSLSSSWSSSQQPLTSAATQWRGVIWSDAKLAGRRQLAH